MTDMNIAGAKIVEELLSAKDTREIALPNQVCHVSHIAIDVSAVELSAPRIAFHPECYRLAARWSRLSISRESSMSPEAA